MTCIDTIQDCIVRGTTYRRDVGLSLAFTEVVENPAAYEGVLVFRETQDDGVTPYLTLTVPAVIDPNYDPDCYNKPGAPVVYLYFTATADQTQALPPYNITAYCELRAVSVGGDVVRLFNENVTIND